MSRATLEAALDAAAVDKAEALQAVAEAAAAALEAAADEQEAALGAGAATAAAEREAAQEEAAAELAAAAADGATPSGPADTWGLISVTCRGRTTATQCGAE